MRRGWRGRAADAASRGCGARPRREAPALRADTAACVVHPCVPPVLRIIRVGESAVTEERNMRLGRKGLTYSCSFVEWHPQAT